jgi:Protein of unknown function (DUF4232)
VNLIAHARRRIAPAAAVACAAFIVSGTAIGAASFSRPALPAGRTAPTAALAAPAMPASPARRATPAFVRGCETPGLVIWLDTQGNGTAGSIFYHLEFTNLSRHRCTLNGFPFVRAINLHGDQVGRRASFDRMRTPHQVTLRRGKTVTALLEVVEAGNFSRSACRPVTAAGLQVFPPNQTRAKKIPFPFAACSRRGPVYLRVWPVRK